MISMAAVVRELVAAGVTGDALVAALTRIESSAIPLRTVNAERQARYRERRGCVDRDWQQIRVLVLSLYHDECAYCGAPRPSTVDHVIPVSKGGATDITNLVPCCSVCNSVKKDKSAKEFIACL